VVLFVAFTQAAQDRDGVLDGWLADEDGLEATLERGVFFDVLAIFVEGCGADAVQLALASMGLSMLEASIAPRQRRRRRRCAARR